MADDELTLASEELFLELDKREAASERAHQYKIWALSVFCWDGLLPIAVLTIPNLVRFVLPNWQFGVAMVAVFTPVIALSFRFVFGWMRMRSGQSYIWQMIIFTVAISTLFLSEEIILNDQVGRGPKIADPAGLLVMFGLYLAMMAIALFPFRVAPNSIGGGAKPQ